MDKTQRIREFVKISLEDDAADLRQLPVKESLVNLGLGLLMAMVVILHLALGVWQLAVSVLLLGYDWITKGLAKIMPGPKPVANSKS